MQWLIAVSKEAKYQYPYVIVLVLYKANPCETPDDTMLEMEQFYVFQLRAFETTTCAMVKTPSTSEARPMRPSIYTYSPCRRCSEGCSRDGGFAHTYTSSSTCVCSTEASKHLRMGPAKTERRFTDSGYGLNRLFLLKFVGLDFASYSA